MKVDSSVQALVAREATEAAEALPRISDDGATGALAAAAGLLAERSAAVLEANRADLESADLDAGALDRLRLDDARLAAIGDQLRAMADLPPLEREIASWTLPNGLHVSERRIPIGVVGANFEARPNVAIDVAAQLLKSRNAGVLRTGGAALRTVTALVDDVLRPGLELAGLPSASIGLVRTADREGARALVSLPRLVPLVILRGSGATTAALARLAAEHGVRTLAHAEGGGVLYLHEDADHDKARALIRASLDRLGVCNRLNLLVVDRKAAALSALAREELAALEIEPTTERGHEWANEADRISTVTVAEVEGIDEALRVAHGDSSGLAATIVTEDENAARAFLDGYRGTAAFWQAPTRFTDGFALTGAPETGINVDWTPGPRGPVTYRDLWLRQYRVIGDGTQRR
jgi:glutamate-5-semialdehyde dehydrogenase